MSRGKSKDHKKSESVYFKILDNISQDMGKNITFTSDLNKAGKKYLGNKFKGAYPSDRIPKLNRLTPYAIINVDNSKQRGSHWLGIALAKDDSILVYDSFGRDNSTLVPTLSRVYKNVKDTEKDAEQRIKEHNCGQRSLAWLIFFDKYGEDAARNI